MLVEGDHERLQLLEQALVQAGHEIIAQLPGTNDLLSKVVATHPDIVLIDLAAPGPQSLAVIEQVARERPLPVVLFAPQSDFQTTRRALHAGVSAYVVGGLSAARINPVIEVAIARFEELQSLKQELADTRLRLADRQDIEKAKGLLMQRRGMDEATAYKQLRKMAMERNLKLGDAARAVLAAAELI